MNFVILNPQRNPRIQPRIDMSFENLLLKLKIEENIFENENFSEFVLPIFFLKIVISLRKSRCHICIKDRNLLSNDFGQNFTFAAITSSLHPRRFLMRMMKRTFLNHRTFMIHLKIKVLKIAIIDMTIGTKFDEFSTIVSNDSRFISNE